MVVMRRAILFFIVCLLAFLTPFAVRYLQYYRLTGSERSSPPRYVVDGVPIIPTPAAGEFQDAAEPGPSISGGMTGIALLDLAHENQFELAELTYLDGLLTSRGFDLLPYTGSDLSSALRSAGAFIAISPLQGYSAAEVLAVREFVNRGGRLLLVGDPTRYEVAFDEDDIFAEPVIRSAQIPLNDLANAFDVTFRGDYLYNTSENEGNFRNIVISESGLSDELTFLDGLEKLVFYSSHSLDLGPSSMPVLSGDDQTWSSATDRPGGLILAAMGSENEDSGQVLALGDFHVLTDPYNSVFDNAAFVARVADFLVEGGRSTEGLASFPYFFRPPVDHVYSGNPDLGPDAFDEVIALQESFRDIGLPLALVSEPDPEHDTLLLGLYNQADDVAELLERAGIEMVIRPAIQPVLAGAEDSAGESSAAERRVIESALGTVQMSGTALIMLDTNGDRQQLVVLAASGDGLESAVNRLEAAAPVSGVDLSDCLLQDDLALCPTNLDGEPVEYELQSSGLGEASPSPEADEEDREDDPDGPDEPGTVDQGSVSLGETVSGETHADEIHSWTFDEGPLVVDIAVDGAEDFDAVVAVLAPNNEQLANADSTFAGDTEEILGLEIPDDGTYTIVIRDFFNDGGGYELSVSESQETGNGGEGSAGYRIFVFADDDGQPIGEPSTSADIFAGLLSPEYDVTTWTSTVDGPLPEDLLTDYDLLIWDSGTYRDEDGLLGDDAGRILEYLDTGGDVLITGSSPSILGPVELAPLANLAVVAEDPILTDGFEDGELLALDDTYEIALGEMAEPADTDVVFLSRAPGEEGEGAIIGLAGIDSSNNDQKSLFLFIPFSALAEDVRGRLLSNILAWLVM